MTQLPPCLRPELHVCCTLKGAPAMELCWHQPLKPEESSAGAPCDSAGLPEGGPGSCVRWTMRARHALKVYSNSLREPSRGSWSRLSISQSLPRPCEPPAASGSGAAVCKVLTELGAEPPTPGAVLQIRAKRDLQGGSGSVTPSISSHASEVQLGQAFPPQATLAHWQHQNHGQQGGQPGTAAGSPEQVHLQSTELPALSLLCCPPPHVTADCRWPARDDCAGPEGALLPFSALRSADRIGASANSQGGWGGHADSRGQPLQRKRWVCSR